MSLVEDFLVTLLLLVWPKGMKQIPDCMSNQPHSILAETFSVFNNGTRMKQNRLLSRTLLWASKTKMTCLVYQKCFQTV